MIDLKNVTENLTNPLRLLAAVLAIIIGVRGVLTPYLTRVPVFDWHYNYEQYETTILHHTNRTVTHVTQFIPKGLCQFQGDSVATGYQTLPSGAIYSRKIIGHESRVGMELIPARSPDWVSLDPYTQNLSGFSSSYPITIYFKGEFLCKGKPAIIKFDPIVVPALEGKYAH